MKTYRLFFVSVYRFIWNTFLYDISSILLIIFFKLATPFRHSDDRIAFFFPRPSPFQPLSFAPTLLLLFPMKSSSLLILIMDIQTHLCQILRCLHGRRSKKSDTQIKTTRVNGWFALRLKAFVTNHPLKGL